VVNSKTFPNLSVIQTQVLSSATSAAFDGTSGECFAISIHPTGTSTYLSFDGTAATTSELKIEDGQGFFMHIRQEQYNNMRYLTSAGGTCRLYIYKQI
jgi:hypothetical protein